MMVGVDIFVSLFLIRLGYFGNSFGGFLSWYIIYIGLDNMEL